jgi:hypothetical protein
VIWLTKEISKIYKEEPFFRSHQFLSYSRNFPHLMETEGSLPLSQKRATFLYHETDQFTSHPIIFLEDSV